MKLLNYHLQHKGYRIEFYEREGRYGWRVMVDGHPLSNYLYLDDELEADKTPYDYFMAGVVLHDQAIRSIDKYLLKPKGNDEA